MMSSIVMMLRFFQTGRRDLCEILWKTLRQNPRTPVLEGDFEVDRGHRFQAIGALTGVYNYWDMPIDHQRWVDRGETCPDADVLERIAVAIAHAEALGP